MSEATPEAPPQESAAQPSQDPPAEQGKPTEDQTDWRAEARKWENRAKENGRTAKELEKQRLATMSEADKAIAEAEERGRTAERSSFGVRLARTEFDAIAGRRNPDFDTASALEWVDLSRFVDEHGEPDTRAITKAVERLVPEPANGPPSFDGGTRTPATKQADMNTVLRRQLGRT